MAKKAESQKKGMGKIASYVAKYSNASSGAGYKGAIEAFLRSVYKLEKKGTDGKKITHDYENLFDTYLTENRNRSQDVKMFSEYLVRESTSKQSARQILTYAAKFLRAYGVEVLPETVQDIKREIKGGSATIEKTLTGEIICHALKGADVRNRAIFLTLASSGLRIGEALSLSMKDIDLDSTPVKIVVRAAKSKNKQARFTFITPEAADAVRAWIRNRDTYLQGSAKHNQNLIKAGVSAPVNTDSDLLFPVSDSQVNAAWETCLRKAGLYAQDAETGRNVYRIHALRKFFYSQLSMALPEKLVQYLVGHSGYLDGSYMRITPEYAAAEFLKVQDCLTCCVPETVKATIRDLTRTTVNLQKQDGIQLESIEYLRSVNKQMAARLDTLQETVNALVTHIKTTSEYQIQTMESTGE